MLCLPNIKTYTHNNNSACTFYDRQIQLKPGMWQIVAFECVRASTNLIESSTDTYMLVRFETKNGPRLHIPMWECEWKCENCK